MVELHGHKSEKEKRLTSNPWSMIATISHFDVVDVR